MVSRVFTRACDWFQELLNPTTAPTRKRTRVDLETARSNLFIRAPWGLLQNNFSHPEVKSIQQQRRKEHKRRIKRWNKKSMVRQLPTTKQIIRKNTRPASPPPPTPPLPCAHSIEDIDLLEHYGEEFDTVSQVESNTGTLFSEVENYHAEVDFTRPDRLVHVLRRKRTVYVDPKPRFVKYQASLEAANGELDRVYSAEAADEAQALRSPVSGPRGTPPTEVAATTSDYLQVSQKPAAYWESPPEPLPQERPLSTGYQLSVETIRLLTLYSTFANEPEDTGKEILTGVPAFSPSMLTAEDRQFYEALSSHSDTDVLFAVDGHGFTGRDAVMLMPGKWLNDTIVNGYMKLLQLRNGSIDGGPSCHFCKTFLINHIFPQYNYNRVERWTTEKRLKKWGQQKRSILECDLLFFPVHLNNNHWVLVVADLNKKVLRYYDSLGAGKSEKEEPVKSLLVNIRQYIIDESVNKGGKQMSEEDLGFEIATDMPQQQNGSDCGVYATRTAKELSGNNRLHFTQEEMHDYRILIVKELAAGELMSQ